MEGSRFDDFVRRLGAASSRRRLIASATGGIAALLLRQTRAARDDMVTLCHMPGPHQTTITVAASSVQAHLDHGDIISSSGCCPDSAVCNTKDGTVCCQSITEKGVTYNFTCHPSRDGSDFETCDCEIGPRCPAHTPIGTHRGNA